MDTTALMKAASNKVFFPSPYDTSGSNQKSLHEIANAIIEDMKARPSELGGWSDPASANEARGMIKDLATVLYHVVPHASAFRRLGQLLPSVFVKAAEAVCARRKDIPKESSQQLCLVHARRMDKVVRNPLLQAKPLKLRSEIQSLDRALHNHPARMRKHLAQVLHAQSQTARG